MKKNNILYELGIKYGTDKAVPHNYLYVYEDNLKHLKDQSISLLEIGVCNGASIKMWEEYFSNGLIYGVDIENKSAFESHRVRTYQGDQANRIFLNQLPDSLDVIIDDGGHTMQQQIISFGCLFKKLKSGGIYILEDLITSLWSSYGGNQYNINTTLSAIYNLKTNGKIDSIHLLPEEKEYIEENTGIVNIFGHYGDESVSTKAITSIIIKK